MGSRIVFALGSNLGDRANFLKNAKEELTDKLGLKNIKSSNILQNKALLLDNSPKSWDIDFFNIAFSGDIDLQKYSPLEILEIIKKIEVNLGRVDRGIWSPREIDIDILAIDNLIVNEGDKLQIPHKELFNRDFFIDVFEEIEPKLFNNIRTNIEVLKTGKVVL